MNDDNLLHVLTQRTDQVADDLLSDTRQFLAAIEMASQSSLEEAVPAEMMQMFTDDQWTRLIFEFQVGTTLFTSNYDVASVHQNWIEKGSVQTPVAGEQCHWLIYADQEGSIVRLLNLQEFRGLQMVANGEAFSTVANALWPQLSTEKALEEMTEMLLVWLNDGLIIDAGVPLPEDAEFESESPHKMQTH